MCSAWLYAPVLAIYPTWFRAVNHIIQKNRAHYKHDACSEPYVVHWLPQEDDFRNFMEEFKLWCISEEVANLSKKMALVTPYV